jgi:predicted DNA-binding transcriptional regulator YafY
VRHDSTRTEAALRIILILLAQKQITQDELAYRFGRCERTMRRIRDAIVKAGWPLIVDVRETEIMWSLERGDLPRWRS